MNVDEPNLRGASERSDVAQRDQNNVLDMKSQIEMKLVPNNHSVGLALAGFRTLVAHGVQI